ncbi:GTPase RhebL1 isoform X1 [Tursiops truncatus]|uniref:GTPase RhebL1 isoform X1 n=1 Tax=Tursiops truncatus TaxID=9739 RepID=A0A2U4BA50_TURTR|nr:GTPase RhebL1 isoform X1 [Tursiops truncatus]
MPLVRYRKVVILGYRSVGKTSLAHQFVEGEFLEGYDPTVENTYSKIVTLGKDEFHLHLVDTAGQDEYSILPYSFIIGVHGYVLVYSVTSLHSFQVIESLYQKLHEGHGKTRLPVVLVGNKADLSPDRYGNLCSLRRRKVSWTRNEPGSCRGSATDSNQSFYLFISNLKGRSRLLRGRSWQSPGVRHLWSHLLEISS